jgi:hypothetical protein
MLDLLKQHWNRLAGFAVSIVTLLSGFVAPPPGSGSGDLWFTYGKFLVALLSGIWLVPMQFWSGRQRAWYWWGAAVAISVASTGVFVHYNRLLDRWTVPYWRDRRAVVGSILSPDAQLFRAQQVQQGHPMDELRLLQSYGGNAASVWNPEEISYRQQRLTCWYLAAILLLASAVISVAQASYCLNMKVTRQAKGRRG